MTVTQQIRERDSKVLDILGKIGRGSLRLIGQLAGLSKDAVKRAFQSLDKRQAYPESLLWQMEAGREWLCRLVIAVLLDFGIKDGIGAERLSRFFHRIHLEKEVGVSETALLRLMHRLEERVIEYGRLQESGQTGKTREIILGGDETFFADMMLLVAMELSSGYLFLEEPAPNRSFETWSERLDNRLKFLGCHVRHFVSDRAKALIKLAMDGLGCCSGADLFHAQQDLTHWLGAGFWRKLGAAQKAVSQARSKVQAMGIDANTLGTARQTPALKAVEELARVEAEQKRLEQGKEKFRGLLHGISKVLHPFSLTGKQQDAPQVAQELHTQTQALAALGEEYAIPDKSGKLGKFTRQIGDLVSGIDAWWLWVAIAIESLKLSAEQTDWVRDCLLPKVYWEQQAARADTPELRSAYQAAYQAAKAVWQAHPLTAKLPEIEIQRCHLWAEQMSRRFQRTSSAIEGRNGYLSRIYQNGRGLGATRIRAVGVVHNFDTYRADETTPAERLFGTRFPDLFEWLLQDIGSLPLPRAARKNDRCAKPLILQTVAA